MQMKYGAWTSLVNGVQVDSRSTTKLQNGIVFGYEVELDVSGFLEGSTQQDLSLQQLAMRNAFKVQGLDLVLYHDDGTASATSLSSAQSVTGVIITDGPNFPKGPGDYATLKRFDFSAKATFYNTNANSLLIDFKETLEFSGGGPLYVMKPALVGPPQRQLVYQQTPYVVIQRGSATGLLGYPSYPRSTWPFAENPSARRTSATGPDRDAKLYKNWTVNWEYVHEWGSPLIGFPNIWG